MSVASSARSVISAGRRLKNATQFLPTTQQCRHIQLQTLPPEISHELAQIRLPRAVQATYMAPLRRQWTHGIKTCEIQFRSYSVRNLEVFADFAMRAAYFLNLPANGPFPLPKIIERWTVPRGNFVHKKSQENFERVTLRRQIAIRDGHPETVAIWLAFLKKYQYYGVGMKANVWDHSGLDVQQDMDAEAESISEKLGEQMELFGRATDEGGAYNVSEQEVTQRLQVEPFKGSWGALGAMGGSTSVGTVKSRTVVPKKKDIDEKKTEEKNMDKLLGLSYRTVVPWKRYMDDEKIEEKKMDEPLGLS